MHDTTGRNQSVTNAAALSHEVALELRKAIRPPFNGLGVVLVNVTILLGGWFLVGPRSVTNTDVLIFLPFAIAVWAFADVPVTNVLGANAAASLAVLDDPVRLRRMFTVRDLSLWILISPACVVLSLALLPSQGHTPTSIAVIFAVNALPFGYMGVASPLAPLLAYHPIPLRQRLARPRTWPRWLVAVTAPLVLVFPAAVITLLLPAYLFRVFNGEVALFEVTPFLSIFNVNFVLGNHDYQIMSSAVSVVWGLALWRLGLRLTTAIVAARKNYLRDLLGDPTRS